MTHLEAITERLRSMAPEQQRDVLDFADFLLARRPRNGRPRRSIGGTCEDLGVSISASDIDEMRKEMWAAIPRSDV